MLRILTPLQALLNDSCPERTWELVYDCGHFGTAWTLAPNGQIEQVVEGVDRVQVHLAERTEEELEAGVRALLLQAATTAVRPQDAYDYFMCRDTPVGWDHGGVVEVDGEMFIVCDPEFLGVVGRSRTGCGAAIFNPLGVVRVDPTAPAFVPPRPVIDYAAIFRRRHRLKTAARRRARQLFFRFLTREQKWELRAHQRVTTIGQDGRTYRIHEYQGGNVHLVEDGIPTTTLCVVANPAVVDDLPIHDLMLAQKILLESNVAEFLKTARSWPFRPPAPPAQRRLEDLPHPMVRIDHRGLVERLERWA
jgi:hypothetical protein